MGSVQWPDNIIRPDVFCTLSRLRSISIHSQAFWDDLPADLKAVFQTIFSLPTLSKVSIGPNVYLPASLVFKPPLTSFEWGLLGPGNQFCYEDAGHLPAAPLPKRILKTLSLSMTSQIPQWAFDWLMDRHCPIAINRLEALRIFVYDSYEPTLSLEILEGTAKSLTILHLEINSMWTREPIDLSQCSNLRKLYLRFYHWLEATDDDDDDPPSSSLNGTIGTLPPDNNVEEIGIRLDRLRDDLHLDEEETLTDIVSELPWEEFDQLLELNQPRMEKLRSVLWKVNKEIGAIIVQCLPETHQRGLLTFTHKSDAQDEDDPMLVVGHRFGF
ncbi:hypothetical protein BDN72DRAFT_881042 [Pluteus cervinus]|uniref:Uncharacterized protein n=1 Tax=Pluteus cervinus TaxID=181527 RepID=A0ACD3AJ48_9AGAR|nr:hypothetical protein BDN72DRAFT_881042 [Pluteus cervinus]